MSNEFKSLARTGQVFMGMRELSTHKTILDMGGYGFMWGMSAKSTDQLAFAMLYEVSKDKVVAQALYAKFRDETLLTIAGVDENFTLTMSDLRKWIEDNSQTVAQFKALAAAETPKIPATSANTTAKRPVYAEPLVEFEVEDDSFDDTLQEEVPALIKKVREEAPVTLKKPSKKSSKEETTAPAVSEHPLNEALKAAITPSANLPKRKVGRPRKAVAA
jgi:hypothetical protein